MTQNQTGCSNERCGAFPQLASSKNYVGQRFKIECALESFN
jgi:hypothetical protein